MFFYDFSMVLFLTILYSPSEMTTWTMRRTMTRATKNLSTFRSKGNFWNFNYFVGQIEAYYWRQCLILAYLLNKHKNKMLEKGQTKNYKNSFWLRKISYQLTLRIPIEDLPTKLLSSKVVFITIENWWKQWWAHTLFLDKLFYFQTGPLQQHGIC